MKKKVIVFAIITAPDHVLTELLVLNGIVCQGKCLKIEETKEKIN